MFDVWITGVRRDQTHVRQAMREEEPGPFGVRRLHPMLDWTDAMVADYLRAFDLPAHPLVPPGSGRSIGCEPCSRTAEDDESKGRRTRWMGLKKTECGLHSELRGQRVTGRKPGQSPSSRQP
jgi:phosphoadenosine phosphosulfate reductase